MSILAAVGVGAAIGAVTGTALAYLHLCHVEDIGVDW